jgi:ABC-type Fe3+ transport system substrate-binding protein
MHMRQPAPEAHGPHRRTRRALRCAVVGSTLLLLLVACAPAAPQAPAAQPAPAAAQASPQLQALIEGARREGAKLELTHGVFNEPELLREWTEGFNRLYGLDLQITNTPEPAMNQGAAKLIQELQAGRPASTDVFLSTEVHVLMMMQANALEKADWSWAPNVKPELIEADGHAVQYTTSFRGVVYNANRVRREDVPERLEQLLDLSARYSVAMPPQASVYDVVSTPEVWGEERTKDFLTKLSPNLKGLMLGHELHRVGSGEFDFFGLDFGRDFYERFKAQGQPLGWVFPRDAAISTPTYNSIPKHAPHPNTAKLWVSYVMSKDGYDILWKRNFVDHAGIPGSHSAKLAQEFKDQGYRIVSVDVEFTEKYQRSFTDIRRDLQEIIRRR